MGWWSIGRFPDELMGDGPADVAAEAFAKLREARDRAGKAPPRYEDIAALLTAAASRSGKDVSTRKHCTLEGLVAEFRDGSPEIRLATGEVAVASDELAVMRDLVRRVVQQYRDALDRRPSMREMLAAAAFVLRPVPNSTLAPEETRELAEFQAIYRDDRGQISADDVVATMAATMWRNERRLGLVAAGGEALQPQEIVATTPDGQEIRISCAVARAPGPGLVEDVVARFDAITKAHGRLLSLDDLVVATLESFRVAPERFAKLSSLRVLTTPRAPEGRPALRASAPEPDVRLRVRHAKFGAGTVLRMIDDGQKKYEIAFDDGTTKTLLARFVDEI